MTRQRVPSDSPSSSYAHEYDPYGVAVLTAGGGGGNGAVQNPFLFNGGIQDRATGWVHYGNRWYNPTIGRWTQQDTLHAPLDPAGANRYAYAGCDPINNVDPTGKSSCNYYINLAIGTGGLTFLNFIGILGTGYNPGWGVIFVVLFIQGAARTVDYAARAVQAC